jgi:hypothetical protein
MPTVLILGAGASLAQAASYRPQQLREHPPLDGSFFAKFAEIASRNNGVELELRALQAAVQAHGDFPDPFGPASISLEQFFADVYYEVASARSGKAFSVFLPLLKLYNRALAATTNWFAVRHNIGILGKLLRHELSADPEVTIVTFNHDLVIENAVARLPRVREHWCLKALYGEIDAVPIFGQGPGFPHHNDGCTERAPVTLLKLHGSLNWGVRSRKADPTLNTLFPSGSREIFYHNLRHIAGAATLTFNVPRGRSRWHFWPLVVPPIYEKSKITGIGLLDGVWRKARAAIEKATRLVVVGYSLPDADVLAAQMVRRAFIANRHLDSIHCVNPDPGLVAKLQTKLECNVVHLYRGLKHYIAQRDA